MTAYYYSVGIPMSGWCTEIDLFLTRAKSSLESVKKKESTWYEGPGRAVGVER